MPVPCARVVCEPRCLTAAIDLLTAGHNNIDTLCAIATDSSNTADPNKLATPKWLQAILTFIDIWGKTMKIAKWWRPERHVGIYNSASQYMNIELGVHAYTCTLCNDIHTYVVNGSRSPNIFTVYDFFNHFSFVSPQDCIVVWQWFENSRWCSYSHDLGLCLERAYLDGEYCYR